MPPPFSVSGSSTRYLSLVAARLDARRMSWSSPAAEVTVSDALGHVLFSYQNGRCWAVMFPED